ncbi:MAG: tetratricopeptide repeat protein [Desulfobulbaceae bacterium]|nr:tetratricopeptide repeat protein [Desulfobulbaceae bacterium]
MTTKEDQPKTQAQLDYADGQEFMKKKELAQAAAAFHNALVGFEQDGDVNGVANAADKMGDLCLERTEFDKALAYYDRAYEICNQNFDRYSLFSLERKKAKVYEQAGDNKKAISAYVGVIDEYNALRDPQGAVDALETLAGLYLKVSDKEMAADCYRTIASIHKNYKHNNFYKNYMEKAEATLAS